MKYLFTILLFLLLHQISFEQDTAHSKKTKDSVPLNQKILTHKDSLRTDSSNKLSNNRDSAEPDFLRDNSLNIDSLFASAEKKFANPSADSLKHDSLKIIKQNPANKKKVQKNNLMFLMPGTKRNIDVNYDIEFYILIFLLFFLGLIKTSFPKYVNSIFSLSFQATFRQIQTKEQLSHNFFPAFMLNVLFVLCGGLFITLFAEFNQWSKLPFWQLFVYSTAILLIIYFVKYLVINFTGWVFKAKDAAAEYSFVVFLINKLLGILLLPLLFLIAYASNGAKNISITIVICLVFFSLAIRYLVSLARIRKNLNVAAFHFFIYLCAVEIIPLLVIYKLFLQTSNR